ncbi:MAG: (2Fe-2S)-binding protein [Halobacteriales archaeon]
MVTHDIHLTIDGRRASATVEARTLLLHALRETFDATAPKAGCDTGTCGACTVLLDGRAVKSCTQLAVQADGRTVTTAAGLAEAEHRPVQTALHDHHGLQCGYCTPGVVATAVDLIEHEAALDEAAVREGLKGNVCRCTGYHNLVAGVLEAADEVAGDR